MFTLVEQLKELLKSYTVAASVANASRGTSDIEYAQTLLKQINSLRLSLALQAEMRQIFYAQLTVPATATDTVQNQWYSKNDRAFVIRRGIAALDDAARINLLNQGDRMKAITREMTAWQQVFSAEQVAGAGQRSTFDLPEELRFSANQALDVAVLNQVSDDGQIWLHGASIKEDFPDVISKGLQEEFLNPDGSTKYLPTTQIVPLTFNFTSNVAGTVATDPSGNNEIFTVKNERSVLLTEVSTSDYRYTVSRLSDEGRNQTIAELIDVVGMAGYTASPYATYYPLPYPHLLRAGDRLKARLVNGTTVLNIAGQVPANQTTFLTFKGITL